MKYFEAGVLIYLAIKLWVSGVSGKNTSEQSSETAEEEVSTAAEDDA